MENFQMCELTKVMRQRGDAVLIDLLNNVRVGELTTQDENLLCSKFINETNEMYPLGALHIFAENEPARAHNERMLESIDSALIETLAIDLIPKKLPSYVYDKVLSLNQSKTGGLSHKLSIKIEARVMLTSNVDISDKLINGQIGTVAHLSYDHENIKTIYINFDNENVGENKILSDKLAQELKAVPIDRVTTEIKTNEKKLSSPIIKRTHFPLMLAWACTVHKVQGLSLKEVVIGFNLLKQRSFNSGQMYVAISRVTYLQGLHLIGQFKRNAIVVDQKANNEYKHLRENQTMKLNVNLNPENIILSIIISNVRSLRKHLRDMACDCNFLCNDIILCTETQIATLENPREISIDGFELVCNNSEHKFSSLAMYYSSEIDLLDHFMLDGYSVFEISKLNRKFKILLIYRKKDFPVRQFLECLGYISMNMDIDIVVGDFNMKPGGILEQTLPDFVQLVVEPTHLGGPFWIMHI